VSWRFCPLNQSTPWILDSVLHETTGGVPRHNSCWIGKNRRSTLLLGTLKVL
jgi:hypothetical protein